ncbi:FecR family protein [Prolixibacteraceae bacterium JC049]|nr:FecR family protein [Prolixibacteraceae bacterium JC049]
MSTKENSNQSSKNWQDANIASISDADFNAWLDNINEASSVNVNDEWNKLNASIETERPIANGRNIALWIARIAAIIIFAFTSYTTIIYFSTKKEVNYHELSLKNGQQAQLSLPDGSKVWLYANSTIRYPDQFNDGIRAVELTGEAFFVVKHQKTNTPFQVKAGKLTVEVLGTRFNVSAYKNSENIETALISGKVKLSIPEKNGLKSITMKPSEGAIFNTSTGKIQRKQINSSYYLARKEGKLIFDKTPLPEVFKQLERNYGIRIIYNHLAFKDRTFKANFAIDEDINQVFNIMQKALDLKIERKEKVISIKQQ